ncbi:NFACT family protein [Lactiplantibacillus pentosus]|uniref:Rqc2 homolog RqcH n=1 Tax=Lactiplantibacillus pentosus MP-10 TaxID=1028490 RepID=F6IRX2_LACPE|nr:NFACT RNA binding domain-containing protein [Lactiplantibacillus pentosus]MBU7496907.1 NFACT family protein [Lactiplantibacillus pentosus]WNN83875.1 NFACT RNA binding domain-containing protein [Lactiplantibacillus pentosus]CCB81274.1 adherence protein [Lactiplantibacillus pentosus MP-10]
MSFDGLFTHAMVTELRQTLVGGRISKINQPYQNELILTIRANRQNYPVLLSADPTYPRIQTTQIPYVNPAVPTNFAMMMRKYLQGAVVTAVTQMANDRVVHLTVATRNELGDAETLTLIIEIMARHSNVILVDDQTSKIIDVIKHVGADQNRYRLLLPGATYIQPPKQDKIDPFTPNTDYQTLVRDYPNEDVLAKQLQQHYQGLGRDSAQQLAADLHQPGDLAAHYQAFLTQFNHPEPTLITLPNRKTMFAAGKFDHFGPATRQFDTLSQLLDFYYADAAQRERVQQQAGNLIRVVKNNLKKNRNKLKKLEQTLANTKQADELRLKGEILTTYLHEVKRGMTEITLPDYYHDNAPLKIQLSTQLSPSRNAQKYFSRYQKQKNAVGYVGEQIDLTQAEIDYLDNIQTQIELASPADIAEIREELTQQGYLKQHHTKKKQRSSRRPSQPQAFVATDGTPISVGKNNRQNDQLTLKTAHKSDYWLHTQKIPGSHVIVHSDHPSETTLMEAANLAAYFSKARDSATVPVDYVQVRRIRKPNGAKPGFVIYEGQKTLYVSPDAQLVEQLTPKD